MKKLLSFFAALCCCFALEAQEISYEPITALPSPIDPNAVYVLGYQVGNDYYLHTSGTEAGQMQLSKNPESPIEYKFTSMQIGTEIVIYSFANNYGSSASNYLHIDTQGVSYGTFNPFSSTDPFSLSIVNGDISSASASGYTVCHDNNIITVHTGTSEGNLRFFKSTSKPSYSIAVSASPAGTGTATATVGGGQVESAIEGTSITVTATPASGYKFVNWTENDVEVSTANPYTFTLEGDCNLVANFTTTGQYDFSATCTTGQTLYYKIIDAEKHWVKIVPPNNDTWDYGWNGFTKPTGNITLPETVTHNAISYTVKAIGDYAFPQCTGLTGSLTIPNTVTSIGEMAFNGCSGFTGSLTIPNSVTSIGEMAFNGCSGFTGSLTIGSSVTSIGEMAFNGCSGFTGSLTIGSSVTSIGTGAFHDCSGFTGSLTIGSSVESIGDKAFYDCSGFTGSLTIGNSVASIGKEAFKKCSGFTYIIFKPYTPPILDSDALSTMPNLQAITVPCTVTGGYSPVLKRCGMDSSTIELLLEEGFVYDLTVASSNTNFGSASITQQPDCDTEATVTATPNAGYKFVNWTENGEEVSTANPYTFTLTSDRNLVANFYRQYDFSATCPTGQTLYYRIIDAEQNFVSIVAPLGDDPSGWGDSKPEGDIVLPQTVIHDGIEYVVTEIGDYAFYDCRDLRGLLNIPVTVTRIGASAFKYRFIESIYIGNSVESIGSEALCVFDNTDRHVVSKAQTPPDFEGGFVCMYHNPQSIYIHIPKNTLAAYQSAWGDQYNYIEMNDYAFRPGMYDMWSFWENWSNRHKPELYDNVTILGKCLLDADATVSELRVAAGKTLTIGEGKTLTAVSIILENGAQLINNGTVNCGNVTVKKDIRGYGEDAGNWYLVSSPVTASARTSGMAAPTADYDLYRFSQTGDEEGREWLNYKAEAFGIENQSGYLYASKNDTTIVLSGVFADTEAKTLDYDANADHPGFNLVGNPYPYNAYLADGRSFYRMNKSGTELIVESENPTIAVCEGVFVQAHGTGESLRFTTSAPQGQILPTVALTLSSGTAIDRAIVHLGDGGMLSKMMLNDNNTKLYITQGGKDFAVVSTTAQGGEMPVNFKAAADGTYTLAMNVDNVSVKYLHLVDNLTGNDVDLLAQDPSYTFSAKATNDIARFKLVFSYNDVMEITANQDPDHKKNYYSTFYSSTNAYEVPEGVTAYTGAVNGDVLNLTSITTGIIPAGEAVILRLTTADNTATKQDIALSLTSKTGTKSNNNALTGTDVAKTLGANDYALSLGHNGVGFYLWEDKTIDAHKAYLELTSQAKAFTFRFDDEETDAIHGLTPALSEGEGAIYNLNGVRVNDSYKGIVIKNGKKIYQK